MITSYEQLATFGGAQEEIFASYASAMRVFSAGIGLALAIFPGASGVG